MKKILNMLIMIILIGTLVSCSTPKETSEIVKGKIIAIVEYIEPLQDTYIVEVSENILKSSKYEIEEIKSGLELVKGDVVLIKLHYLDGVFVGGEILSKVE